MSVLLDVCYAVVVWPPRPYLEKVQRRATKLVPKICDFSNSDDLSIIGFPTLSEPRTRVDMIQMFKIRNYTGQV